MTLDHDKKIILPNHKLTLKFLDYKSRPFQLSLLQKSHIKKAFRSKGKSLIKLPNEIFGEQFLFEDLFVEKTHLLLEGGLIISPQNCILATKKFQKSQAYIQNYKGYSLIELKDKDSEPKALFVFKDYKYHNIMKITEFCYYNENVKKVIDIAIIWDTNDNFCGAIEKQTSFKNNLHEYMNRRREGALIQD